MFDGVNQRLASYACCQLCRGGKEMIYQDAHVLDIATFTPTITIRMMRNDVFTEDYLLARM